MQQPRPQYLAVPTDLIMSLVEYITSTPTGQLPYNAAHGLLVGLQNCQPIDLPEPEPPHDLEPEE